MTTSLPHPNDSADPRQDERRRVVARVLGNGPTLIRYASRYTESLADAEDAYQRAMEIALTKAPVASDRDVLAWLYVVVRNEALRIRKARHREQPHSDDELVALAGSGPSADAQDPHLVYAWKERYRTLQDALAGLTTSQKTCVMLRSAGASRQEIQNITGFSLRKVERSIVEGRRRIRDFEMRTAEGAECAPMAELIERTVASEATDEERQRLARHVRHCGACRAEFRDRRDQRRLLSTLVPGAFGASAVIETPSLDPNVTLSWWDRLVQGTQLRVGAATQVWMDIPGVMVAKVSAGAVALALTGAIGGPLVIDAVRPSSSASSSPPVAGSVVRSVDRGQAIARTTVTSAPSSAKRAMARPSRPTKKRAPRPAAPARQASMPSPRPVTPTPVVTIRATTPQPTSHPRGSAEMEFSP